MATYNTLTGLLSAIANAIRSKTGTTGQINAQDFPNKINQIPQKTVLFDSEHNIDKVGGFKLISSKTGTNKVVKNSDGTYSLSSIGGDGGQGTNALFGINNLPNNISNIILTLKVDNYGYSTNVMDINNNTVRTNIPNKNQYMDISLNKTGVYFESTGSLCKVTVKKAIGF